MPETLKLYETIPVAPVESEPPLALNPKCTRCELGAACDDNGQPISKNRCIPADGGAGDLNDLLVVGDGVGKEEGKQGAPFVNKVGAYLRGQLATKWKGRVVLDSAIRCYAGTKDFKHEHADACRGYLSATIQEVKPKRILAMGPQAAYAIFGRNVQPFSTRRGWGWLYNGGAPIPVFFLLPPLYAVRNTFVQQWFEDDLKWALAYNPPKPPWSLPVQVVSSLEESQAACAALRLSEWVAFDVETAGRMYDPDFRLLSISIANSECDLCYVWDAGGIINFFEPVKELLQDLSVKKVGQNVKYDLAAIRETQGFWVENIHGDTRLWRKLIDPEAEANLAAMGELVGMGGHKAEADAFIAEFVSKTKRTATALLKQREKAAAKKNAALADAAKKAKEDENYIRSTTVINKDANGNKESATIMVPEYGPVTIPIKLYESTKPITNIFGEAVRYKTAQDAQAALAQDAKDLQMAAETVEAVSTIQQEQVQAYQNPSYTPQSPYAMTPQEVVQTTAPVAVNYMNQNNIPPTSQNITTVANSMSDAWVQQQQEQIRQLQIQRDYLQQQQQASQQAQQQMSWYVEQQGGIPKPPEPLEPQQTEDYYPDFNAEYGYEAPQSAPPSEDSYYEE